MIIQKKLAALFLTGTLVLGGLNVDAQSSNEPSVPALKQQFKSARQDTVKLNLLMSLSRSYLFKPSGTPKDADSAFLFLREASNLNRKIQNRRAEARIALLSGMIYNYQGLKEKGLHFSREALRLSTALNLKSDVAESLIIIGQYYNNDEPGLSKKMEYYKKAITFFHQAGARNRMATTLKDLADFQIIANQNNEALINLRTAVSIYLSTGYKNMQGVYDLLGYDLAKMGDFVDALKYSLLAVKTAESVNDTSAQLGTIYYRAGFSFYMTKQYVEADHYIDKGLHIVYKFKDTSAIVIMTLNKAYTLMKLAKFNDVIPLMRQLTKLNASTLSPGLGVELAYLFMTNYLHLKQYDKAKSYFDKLKVLARQGNVQGEIHEKALRGIISYYQFTGQYNKSYSYIAEHQRFCQKNNLKIFMPQEQLWLFKADSATHNYISAIKHYQEFKKVDDSILMEKNSRQTALLNVQYESDKKDKDIVLKAKNIQLLTKQSNLQQTKLEQQRSIRNIVICGSSLLLLVLVVGYNRFRLKQRSNLLLRAQQREINEQNLTLQNFNSKQSTLLKEKEWLLREVHHRVKNNLQVTMSLLNIQCSYLDNEMARDAIQDSQRRIHAMSLIHQKLYQSETPTEIDMSIYIPELVDYLKECFGKDDNMRFLINVAPTALDISQAIPLGLILNEAITNAMKYAFKDNQTGTISISLKNDDDHRIIMSIGDDGIGLPADFDHQVSASLGMNLMSGLSAQIEGEFSICSEQGTKIDVFFQDAKFPKETVNNVKDELMLA
ncbi:histidine kinase dimerization/phosphoacceptor domain -containing protein [Mucilaginibacter phyllosphaerae]